MEENVRERDRLRESEQPKQRDRKNTSSFLYESERERVARVFGGEKQREAFEMVLCVWSFSRSALCRSCAPSTRALKGKETVCAPKRGLFLSVSDFFLGKHTTKERDTFLVIF